MRKIEPKFLISEDLADITKEILKEDQVIDIYLHNKIGTTVVSGGNFGSQEINTMQWPSNDEQFAKYIFTQLDDTIDLDFQFTDEQSASDLAIFLDTEITIDSAGDTLGLAISNTNDSHNYTWEIFLNKPMFNGDKNYFRYALIHEIGHTLGLEHPFENNDGDVVDGITDPWESLFPEDTVMAYRTPSNQLWPNDFTANDNAALIALWGREAAPNTKESGLTPQLLNNSSNRFKGTTQADWIIGNRGNDTIRAGEGTDHIEGGLGDDHLLGNGGVDRINGDSGDDIIFGGKGNDDLAGNAGNDYINGGLGDDIIYGGGGSDTISGGDGADKLYGDSGQNIFSNSADGSIDIIHIKCIRRKPGKNRRKKNKIANKNFDIIDELDINDQINLIGTKTTRISIQATTTLGLNGLGIMFNGSLQALYLGDNMSSKQLLDMTTGTLNN